MSNTMTALPAVSRPLWSRLPRAWDRVSIYLPLLLMGGLALGTYWMVRNAPASGNTETARPVVHKPDYFMRNFNIKTYDEAGMLKSEIYGVEARHYPDDDTLIGTTAVEIGADDPGAARISPADNAQI